MGGGTFVCGGGDYLSKACVEAFLCPTTGTFVPFHNDSERKVRQKPSAKFQTSRPRSSTLNAAF